MQFLEDDETGDCCSSGPQHSTPIKSRNHRNTYLDTEDRNKVDCGLNHCTVRLTRDNASTHHSDYINSTSVAIMKHDEGDEDSKGKTSRVALSYNPSAIHQASKVDERKDKMGDKACPGMNICNNSVCTAMFRERNMERSKSSYGDGACTLTAHIEQDIVNKQRREIQLLMEELAIRDQELNDLVSSHQSQVQAWEKDRDKLKEMQEHLKHYEDDLRNRDFQLKTALGEMRRVCEQKKDDVLKLHRTEQEMERLTKQIKDNSVLFKEMENQNKTLLDSIRKLLNDKESLENKQQNFVSALEAKDKEIKNKCGQLSQIKKHFDAMEMKIQTLEEENANLTVESHTWKQKYCLAKDSADQMTTQIEVKDENIQRVTHQLQESLQQAIALQKALFTSNEREKCKDEVLESLRKQQKRTMQELANLRELYESQNKDMPLYYLSIQENKNSMRKDGPRDPAQEQARHDKNMSYHVDRPGFLQHEVRDQSSTFLVKTKVGSQRELKIAEDELNISKDDQAATPQQLSEDDTVTDGGKNEASGKKNGGELRNAGLSNDGRIRKPCARWTTIGTSTSDLSQVERSRPKPRSKSLPRISDRLSSPQSSYLSEQGRHQSLSLNPITKTFSERTTRSISSSPLPTHEYTYTSAKRTTVTSANIFDSQHSDQSQRKLMAKESAAEKRLSNKVNQKISKPHNNEKGLGKPQNLNNKVYESSSDISDTSLQERVNCLDELTPADSDGMCHELERDLSKVSADDLHVFYKNSSDKESSYRLLRHCMLSKPDTQSSSYVKTSEWLDKCMSVKNENENTCSSQTLRGKTCREILKNKGLQGHSPETVHRNVKRSERNSCSFDKTVSNSARNKTQNHNSKCDRSSPRSPDSNVNTEFSTGTVSKGRRSLHLMTVESGSHQPKNIDNISTEKLSQNCDEYVKEKEKDLSPCVVKTKSSTLSTGRGVSLSNNTQRFSDDSLYEMEKSAHFSCSETSEPHHKKNQPSNQVVTVPSNSTTSKIIKKEFKKQSCLEADINSEPQNVNSIAEGTAKENSDGHLCESEKFQNGFCNGNTSCNKSVRIQSPCSEEDIDKFLAVSEMNERHGLQSNHSLKSALKTQNRKFENRKGHPVNQRKLPYDETTSPRSYSRRGYKDVQEGERDEFLEESLVPASSKKEENNASNTQNGASVRNYYYEEKMSSDSETSVKKTSEGRACPNAIPVHSFSRPFTSTKAPSLYKQLCTIRFSEQKKRYEWVTPEEELKKLQVNEDSVGFASEGGGHHLMSSLTRAQRQNKGRDFNQNALDSYDNSNNNNNGSLLHDAEVEQNNMLPYDGDSVMEEGSIAGMEKFHTHFNNIVKKLEFSSDSVLESSRTDFLDASVTKPSHSAVSYLFNESHTTHQSHSQDSGCRTSPRNSGSGQKKNLGTREGSLNDLNQGVSLSLNKDGDMSVAVCMTKSDNNASSEADNEAYCMNLPDYFPDISSVTAADSDKSIDNVQDNQTDELEEDKGGKKLSNEPFSSAPHVHLDKEDCDILMRVTTPQYMRAAEDSAKVHKSTVEIVHIDHSLFKNLPMKEGICTTPNGKCEDLSGGSKRQEVVKDLNSSETESITQLNIDHKSALPNVGNRSEKSIFKHYTSHSSSPGEITADLKHSLEYIQQTSPFISPCDKQEFPLSKSEKRKISTSPLLKSKPSSHHDNDIPRMKEIVSNSMSVEGISADEGSDKFTDRLSTFLEDSSSEDPEETSHICVPMSPASKLHRLLVESQEMIRCFEKSHI